MGLAILALVAVITVLLATGKSVIPWTRIKAAAAMLAVIVPALVAGHSLGDGWCLCGSPAWLKEECLARVAVSTPASIKEIASVSPSQR
jgi:hypothetical protein